MPQCAACQFDNELVERLSILANRFLRPPISEGGTVSTVVCVTHTAVDLEYGCYNPKCRNLRPSITSSIFRFFEKFLYGPSSNPETNPNSVSKQAGGKHIKSRFFTI
jgi:hypothetical protein